MNDKWINRIKNSEAIPPGNWDKIASSLDESFNGHTFPVTLYNLEVAPPPAAWNKIQSSLDEEKTTPVIPVKSISPVRSFLKYAVAACIVGLLVFGAMRYFKIGPDKIDVAVGPAVNSMTTDTPATTVQSSNDSAQPAQSQNATDENALEQSRNTYAKLDINKISKRLYKSPAELDNSDTETAFHKLPELQYPHRAAVNDFTSDNSSDRYLLFKDSEGRFVRISKKLSELYCCVSGEEQDENCTNQLKKWQEKIASSSFVPSPDNFMDILDLVSSLEDNRN